MHVSADSILPQYQTLRSGDTILTRVRASARLTPGRRAKLLLLDRAERLALHRW